MSLTKIYKYKILLGAEKKYQELQKKVIPIYKKYAEVEFLYLANQDDPLSKTEIVRFFDKDAKAVMQKIDSDPLIKKLFADFKQTILDTSFSLTEETLTAEAYSAAGKPHHIEIYCKDLAKSTTFWRWFLVELGYKEYQKWDLGISFKLADTYVVFVQASDKHKDVEFHRCRPGLNHLAFHALNREQVDLIAVQLREKNIKILYEDKHPNKSNKEAYALYFEDPERIKVELVAE